jgi:hypothetical protein
MVVGHNLDSLADYEKRRGSGDSHGDEGRVTPPMKTWVGLYELLDRAGVERDQFYFTNIFVGLKREGGPTGQFAACDAPEFRRWCREFLGLQVTTMRPRVVLVLGVPASCEIAKVAIPAPWPATSRLPPPIAVAARFYGHNTVLVPAHHTSRKRRIDRDADALRGAWNRASS